MKLPERRPARRALEKIGPRQPRAIDQHRLVDPRDAVGHQRVRTRERPVPVAAIDFDGGIPQRPHDLTLKALPVFEQERHRVVGPRTKLAIERRIERDAMFALREVIEVMREDRRA